MDIVARSSRRLSVKSLDLSTSDLVFYSSLLIGCHLTLMFVNQALIYRRIGIRIPLDLEAGLSYGFYASAIVNVILEAVVFFVGWLFIIGMVTLFDGKDDSRRLFGWLGFCYLPTLGYSIAALITLLVVSDGDYTAVTSATNADELLTAVREYLSRGVIVQLSFGRNLAYGLSLVMATEVVHRVCEVTRIKAVVVLASYAGLLFVVSRLTG